MYYILGSKTQQGFLCQLTVIVFLLLNICFSNISFAAVSNETCLAPPDIFSNSPDVIAETVSSSYSLEKGTSGRSMVSKTFLFWVISNALSRGCNDPVKLSNVINVLLDTDSYQQDILSFKWDELKYENGSYFLQTVFDNEYVFSKGRISTEDVIATFKFGEGKIVSVFKRTPKKQPFQQLVEEVDSLIEANKTVEATEKVRVFLGENPSHRGAWELLAAIYDDEAFILKAKQAYERVVMIDPDYLTGILDLAEFLIASLEDGFVFSPASENRKVILQIEKLIKDLQDKGYDQKKIAFLRARHILCQKFSKEKRSQAISFFEQTGINKGEVDFHLFMMRYYVWSDQRDLKRIYGETVKALSIAPGLSSSIFEFISRSGIKKPPFFITDLHELGIRFMDGHRFLEAMYIYRLILKIDPKDREACNKLGSSYYNSAIKEKDENEKKRLMILAEAFSAKACELDPDNLAFLMDHLMIFCAHYMEDIDSGTLLKEKKRILKGICQKCIEVDPKASGLPYFALSKVFKAEGIMAKRILKHRLNKAAKYMEKAIKIEGEQGALCFFYAGILRELGQKKKAIKYYIKAYEDLNRDTFHREICFRILTDPQSELRISEQRISEMKKRAQMKGSLKEALLNSDYSAGVDLFNDNQKKVYGDYQIACLFAACFFGLEELDQTRELLEIAISIDPQIVRARSMLCLLVLSQGDPVEAFHLGKEAIVTGQNTWNAADIKHLSKMSEELFQRYSRLYDEDKENEQVLERFLEISLWRLQLNKKNFKYYMQYLEFITSIGRKKEAEKVVGTMLEKFPRRQNQIVELARAYGLSLDLKGKTEEDNYSFPEETLMNDYVSDVAGESVENMSFSKGISRVELPEQNEEIEGFIALEQYEKAIIVLEKMCKKYPEDIKIVLKLVELYILTNKTVIAEQTIAAAAFGNSQRSNYLYAKALFANKKDLEKAEKSCRKILRSNSGFPGVKILLANILFERSDIEKNRYEIKELCLEEMTDNDKSAEAYFLYGKVLYYEDRELAQRALMKSRQIDPDLEEEIDCFISSQGRVPSSSDIKLSSEEDAISFFIGSKGITFRGIFAGFFRQTKKFFARIHKAYAGELKKHSIILYVDDILDNAILFDLEQTMKILTGENGILEKGMVVLYTRYDQNSKDPKILKKRKEVDLFCDYLRKITQDVDVRIVQKQEIYTQTEELSCAQEINKLITELKRQDVDQNGVSDIDPDKVLAIIRGNALDWIQLSDDYDHDIPLIILNGSKNNMHGFFSFAEAISSAISLFVNNGSRGWLALVNRIEGSEKLYIDYMIYRKHILSSL